jgi:hypothetical protein
MQKLHVFIATQAFRQGRNAHTARRRINIPPTLSQLSLHSERSGELSERGRIGGAAKRLSAMPEAASVFAKGKRFQDHQRFFSPACERTA